MDDVRAVMAAVGSERAALFGCHTGGRLALLLAATYPDQVSGGGHLRVAPGHPPRRGLPVGNDRRGARGSAGDDEGRWAFDDGARFVELPGDAHFPFFGDQDTVVELAQEFLTGARPAVDPDRVLATVLFTDIVDSTSRAAGLGDRRWHHLRLKGVPDSWQLYAVEPAGR
jgi:pimeloyl-ACP methyl ester carboxylesterase